MKGHLEAVSFEHLVKEEITAVQYGSIYVPKCGSYGARTLHTASGKEYVIWNDGHGEVNLSLVVQKQLVSRLDE
jgi:hypothetical protein